jgi:hypothetical protein
MGSWRRSRAGAFVLAGGLTTNGVYDGLVALIWSVDYYSFTG